MLRRLVARKHYTAKQYWLRCAMQCCLYVGILAATIGVKSGAVAVVTVQGNVNTNDMVFNLPPLTLGQSLVYCLVSGILLVVAVLIGVSGATKGRRA